MAAATSSQHNQVDEEENNSEVDEYLDENDVLVEVDDDGDQPMDEDEEDDGEHHEGDELDEDIVVEDNSAHHFSEHKGSVFAVSTHPTEPIAASGGEDDLGYLWNLQSGQVITKLTGHTDSVTNTAFSADGEMVATGGMDGHVRIWRRVGKDNWLTWEFLTDLQGPDEVMVSSPVCPPIDHQKIKPRRQWLRWHPRGSVLLAGSNDGTVWLWQRMDIAS